MQGYIDLNHDIHIRIITAVYQSFFLILKRVERASTDAAREVFGNNYQSVLEQVHVDDDALVEGKPSIQGFNLSFVTSCFVAKIVSLSVRAIPVNIHPYTPLPFSPTPPPPTPPPLMKDFKIFLTFRKMLFSPQSPGKLIHEHVVYIPSLRKIAL